jgi:hypothetical protein
MFNLKVVLVSLFSVSTISCIAAGDSLDKKYAVVLVQLRSENNRIAAMTKRNDVEGLEQVKKDGTMVRKIMMKDFKDDFKYCPVYFYMDTNLNLVKQRKFENILFTADSVPVNNLHLDDKATNYLIVYYGHPNVQKKEFNAGKNAGRFNDNEPVSRGLIINNEDFEQIAYLYKFGYQNFTFKWKKKNKGKTYLSKKYDIEYFPYAAKLNNVLFASDGHIHIRNLTGFSEEVK